MRTNYQNNVLGINKLNINWITIVYIFSEIKLHINGNPFCSTKVYLILIKYWMVITSEKE